MTKDQILSAIRRTAAENGGRPLGRTAFSRVTGIRNKDWYGRHWARWGDALREAGFEPNQMQEALPDDDLLRSYALLIREIGHFPVDGEVRLKSSQDPDFPSHSSFMRFGTKGKLAARIVEFCARCGGFDDVATICAPRASAQELDRGEEPAVEDTDSDARFGFVYLLRSGRHYKIGRTNAFGRRERELAIQLPQAARTVHVIRTDDPAGIEAYWHRRFESKRKNGEWFELDASDVIAFKRRKFM